MPLVIPNYLVHSIIVTIVCCWPAGIPAIVYAAQVNSRIARGDVAGAKDSSDKAKMWCWISLGFGIVAGVVGVVAAFLGAFDGNA